MKNIDGLNQSNEQLQPTDLQAREREGKAYAAPTFRTISTRETRTGPAPGAEGALSS